MKRKAVKQGTSTLMISLPAKWVRRNDLLKGAEIDISEQNNQLIISPQNFTPQKRETTVSLISQVESSIRTIITNAYRKGFDRITVNFGSEKEFRVLTQIITTRLVGFEIVQKNKNCCVVENITEPEAGQFEVMLQKIFYNIEELFEVTLLRMSRKETGEDYREIEERIQRYDNFCRRVMCKSRLELGYPEMMWTFLTLVNHGQRELYFINRLLDANKNASSRVKDQLIKAREMFRLIKSAYLGKNAKLLDQVHQLEKELIYNQGYALLQQSKNQDTLFLYHILMCTREFYQANSPLHGMII